MARGYVIQVTYKFQLKMIIDAVLIDIKPKFRQCYLLQGTKLLHEDCSLINTFKLDIVFLLLERRRFK